MDFRLKVFHSVATNLSFTKASKELFISQPAISKHIHELEVQYKTPLFDRVGSRIGLTHAGELLLSHTKQLLAAYRQMVKALRVERVTLDKQQRWNLFRSFAPVLTMLFFANLFLTVLQDVKEDFLVKIVDVNAAGFSSWIFAKVDGVVTLIILAVFASLALIKSHMKVLSILLALVIAGAFTLSFVAFNYDALQLSPLVWLFIQSLCLYFSYLSFQTIFFDRFIACFRIRGNVGFFIAMIDSIGYTGTVLVLLFKECFNPDLNWLEFYNTMAGTVGVVCCTAFTLSLLYLIQRYRKEKRGEVMDKELAPGLIPVAEPAIQPLRAQ